MLKNVFYPSRQSSTSETGKCSGNDSDLACWFEFLNFANMFGKLFDDPIRIAILRDFHDLRLSMASESEVLDLGPEKLAKRIIVRGYSWTFYS